MTVVEIQQGAIEAVAVPLCDFSTGAGAESSAKSSVAAFLGIPFAQPPIGPLRWKRPQRPAPSWRSEGVRSSAWQRDPMQELALAEFFSKPRRDTRRDEDGRTTISEDCLYLNVWVPGAALSDTIATTKLPVLVWVYGGSFVFGSTSQTCFDGARLSMQSGCIVVSIAYRLGPFGWLGSRQLARCERQGLDGTGNYGAWDIAAGLEWVQENISSFGGDAGNVTVFGESAGSILIHYLLLSAETPPNLFSKAILQSGTALTVPPRTIPSAQATFDAIVCQLGADATASDEEKMALMYDASADDLLTMAFELPSRRPRTEYRVDSSSGRPDSRMDQDQDKLEMEPQSLFGPVWDGVFVGVDFLDVVTRDGLPDQLRNGQQGIILGYCADEGTIFNMAVQKPAALQQHVAGFHPRLVPRIKQLYGVDAALKNEEAFAVCAAYSGDALFQAPIRQLMLQLAVRADVPSYGYLFAHRPSAQSMRAWHQSETSLEIMQTFGTLHTAELPFVFGMDGTEKRIFARESYPGPEAADARRGQAGFTSQERALSMHLMANWAKFAFRQPPWTALTAVTAVEDLVLLTVGRYGTLGSPTPASLASLHVGDSGTEIPVREERLGDTINWTEQVGPKQAIGDVGSQKDRQSFWTANKFENTLIHYYGDERIKFLP